MKLAALVLASFLLVNGGGGDIPPAPERCLTHAETLKIAAKRGDRIVVDSTEDAMIAPFAKRYNDSAPPTNFLFRRVIVIISPNERIQSALILLYYKEGPGAGCGVWMPLHKNEAALLFKQGQGRDA